MHRPSLADVERLARGLAAARRGTGSRAVPHRLNAEELAAYELAKRRGFAVVKGTGHRRERKGSPLLNTLRQRADALDQCLVWCQQARSADGEDICCIDLAPRRLCDAHELERLRERAVDVASAISGIHLHDGNAPLMPLAPDQLDLPIWRLPALVTRFVSSHADPQLSKSLARGLALEFGLGEEWQSPL